MASERTSLQNGAHFHGTEKDSPPCYKSCDAARLAFQSRDIQASREEHMKPLHSESHNSSGSEYIKAVVFGGMDGIMTTFAIIAAAAGSGGNYITVLIFGISNVLADGFAMGFGEYVSGEAERENAASERMREEWEVENSLDLEIEEMIQIYMEKGLTREDSATIVSIISKDPKLFVDFMMVDELGLLVDIEDRSGPLKQVLGVFKGYLIGSSMWWSGVMMVTNGALSGLVSFALSAFLEKLLRNLGEGKNVGIL